MSRFTCACLALVVLAGLATATVESDWAGCLCWDSTRDRMCDTISTSCNRLLMRESPEIAGLSVTILAGMFFLFFPLFFALGRCCNCCGGRSPSYGCCCPYKRLGMQRFYSPATVRAAKFWAIFVFCALVGSAVYMSHSIANAADTMNTISNFAQNRATDAQTLVSQANTAAPPLAQYGVAPITIDMNGTIRKLHDIARSLDSNSPQVRRGLYGEYVPAFVALVICILAFVGVRGIVITSSAMLMSFFACIFLFGLTVVGTGAAAGNFACDSSYVGTTQAFINRSLEINQLSRTVSSAVTQAETAALDAICNTMGLAALCNNGFNCVLNPCNANTTTLTTLDQALTSVYMVVYSGSSAIDNTSMSIAECAQNEAGCPMYYATAQNLMTAYTQILPSIMLLSPSFNSLVAQAIDGTVGVQVKDLLCHSDGARGALLKLTYGFLTMSISCILAVIFFIRGAKRFSSAGSPVYGEYITLAAPPQPPQPQQQRAWGAPTSAEATPMLYGVQVQHNPYAPVEGTYGAAKTGSDVA